jgi:hypothetical protein
MVVVMQTEASAAQIRWTVHRLVAPAVFRRPD